MQLAFLFVLALVFAACSQIPMVPVDAVTTVAEDRPLSDAGSDLRIKASILEAFAEQAKGLLVDASADVYQGQVMLTGSVKKAEDRRKAEELTRGTSPPSISAGVRSMASSICSGSLEARKNSIKY